MEAAQIEQHMTSFQKQSVTNIFKKAKFTYRKKKIHLNGGIPPPSVGPVLLYLHETPISDLFEAACGP